MNIINNGREYKNDEFNNIIYKNEDVNKNEKNIKLEISKVDSSLYVPKLLMIRLNRRNNLKNFSIFFFLFNLLLLGLGILYIDASSHTRRYISKGDDFWNFVFENKLKSKELVLIFSFTGIFEIFASSFNIMNGLVVMKHIFRGGLKIRLSFSIYTTMIIQIINFGFSFFIIIKYNLIINLNIFLLVLNGIHLLNTLIFFYYTRKIIVKEDDYMLSLNTLLKHKVDYFSEYERKLNN